MNARLCSLLVAGGVALVSCQQGYLQAASAAEVAHPTTNLQGMTFEGQHGSATRFALLVPGFQGTPKIQTLSNPDRIVIDLQGVLKGPAVGRKDLLSLDPAFIVRSRIAQFTLLPEPITRLVLEVRAGTKVEVSVAQDQVNLSVFSESKEVLPAIKDLAAATPVVQVETEAVASLEQPSSPVSTFEIAPLSLTPPAAPVALNLVQAQERLNAIPIFVSNQVGLPAIALGALLPTAINTAIPTLLASPQTQEIKKEVLPATSKQSGRTLGEGGSKYTGARMSINVAGTDLVTFIQILADAGKLNLIIDPDVTGSYTFKFTDTPWDQILDLVLKHAGLGKEIQNGVLRVAKIEKLQKEENDRKSLDEARALAGDTQSVYRSLSYAKVSEAKPILEKVLTKRGSVILDERTNTLIVTDLPKNLNLIDDLIATLDVQIQQVQIEAKVVEASDGYEKAFGVKWPTSNGASTGANLTLNGAAAPWGFGPSWNSVSNRSDGSTNPLGVAFSPGANGITALTGAAGEAWVSFISERFSMNFILQALEKEGKVKIVSSPKLVTQNNKKAKILSGEKIPYPTQQGGAQGGAITVAFASANLELDVTPQITSEGTIILDIKIEKSEADFSRTVQGTPTIIQKQIETQVLVRDGGTAVLGGVYSTNKSTGWAGVPFLSKLPIVGGLFRTRSNKDQNSELLIFITPRIIKN